MQLAVQAPAFLTRSGQVFEVALRSSTSSWPLRYTHALPLLYSATTPLQAPSYPILVTALSVAGARSDESEDCHRVIAPLPHDLNVTYTNRLNEQAVHSHPLDFIFPIAHPPPSILLQLPRAGHQQKCL